MKKINICKQFQPVIDLGYENLIVSGCSFTYNNHNSIPVSWPAYLRDLGGFDQLVNLALPGAGNRHISTSMQWYLENNSLDENKTLIVVMWSGNERDDDIISHEFLNNYPMKFYFNQDVVTAIRGGPIGIGNVPQEYWFPYNYKTQKSRAIENYLYISSLYHYLKAKNYTFLFLNYLDISLPNRTIDFDIVQHLPNDLRHKLGCMINKKIENIYTWCLKKNLLETDDFHPTPDGHLTWTKHVLLPFLSN